VCPGQRRSRRPGSTSSKSAISNLKSVIFNSLFRHPFTRSFAFRFSRAFLSASRAIPSATTFISFARSS
jgi:hypothetical protein